MIRVEIKTSEGMSEHPYLGSVPTFTWSLVDMETGRKVASDEVRRLFAKLEIIGVRVMTRIDVDVPKTYPFMGTITNIDDHYVKVDDAPIPRDRFLEWYELD